MVFASRYNDTNMLRRLFRQYIPGVAVLFLFESLVLAQESPQDVSTTPLPQPGPYHLRIASARSAKDLGIIDALVQQFQKKFPDVTVTIQSGGVLKVLDDGRNGLVDVVLTHHKPGEEHFVKEGYARLRTQLMYTEYALFGPPGDPARISAQKNIIDAFKQLATQEAEFHVPSPRSGTNMKIEEIWTMAGVNPDWLGYENTGGSGYATLLQAAEFGVYTVAEMATYLANKHRLEDKLIPLFRDDLDLRNVYSLIVVNPEKVPGVNADLAQTFHDYLVSEHGQDFIRGFGEENYHASILEPAAHMDPALRERRAEQALRQQSKELRLVVTASVALFMLLATSLALYFRVRVVQRRHTETQLRNEGLLAAKNKIVQTNLLLQKEIEERKSTEARLSDAIEKLNASEQELKKYHEHLESLVSSRTQELEAAIKELQAFSYSVSHDLRSPLRSINGFSNALMEDYGGQLDDAGKNYLERIVNASIRMDSLIDGLLQLSRISRQDLNCRPINLSNIARDVLGDVQQELDERKVIIDIADNLVTYGDDNLIRIVLGNLLTNAIKYTRNEIQSRIEVGKVERNSSEYFYVKDNGVGFDMKYADKLFGPFQRLHGEDEFKGSGIGLSTVQRIVNRHGGIVWAESMPGEGATFYFSLLPVRHDSVQNITALPN